MSSITMYIFQNSRSGCELHASCSWTLTETLVTWSCRCCMQGQRTTVSAIQERPSLWGNDAFSPLFQISTMFPTNLQTPWKISQIWYLFPKKFSIFIRQNFWWPFFSLQPQISNSPYFWYFNTFPPVSTKLFFPRILSEISPLFSEIYVFFTYFVGFSFPPAFTMMHLFTTITCRQLETIAIW